MAIFDWQSMLGASSESPWIVALRRIADGLTISSGFVESRFPSHHVYGVTCPKF